ncbi:MAG: hypothetical protein AAB017_05070, partial [Nitrospirota bacterium]
ISELSSAREKIENLRNQLSGTKEDIASNISRLESLRELILDAPTREILSEGSNLHIISSLSDILSVEPEYEKAVENALSEKINSFILKSPEDIELAISILKAKGIGRMAFMPLTPKAVEDAADVPAGIIGRAADFVKVDAGFADIAKNLLSNVLIVKDLRTALAIRESGTKALLVTLDGEISEPSGAVIGGEGRGVLKRKREIREIEEIIEQKKIFIARMQEDFNRLQLGITEKESGIRDIESVIVNTEKEMSLSKLTSENYREEKERIDRKLAYLSIELEEIAREKEAVKKLLLEKETVINAGESKKHITEKDMSDLLAMIPREKINYEEQRAHITDLRLSITSLKEKTESIQKEKDAAGSAIEELLQKNNSVNDEIKSVEDRISQREKETGEHKEKIKGMVLNADGLREKISAKRETIEQDNQKLLSYEQGIKTLRHDVDSLSAKISELDIEKTEHRMRIENLTGNIRQNYGAEIDTLTAEPLLPEDEERLNELKTKIQELGQVNLGTLEEYEELSTRYEFLSKQQEDLSKSIAELEEAITKIN